LIAPISWQALTTAIAFIASVNFTPFKIWIWFNSYMLLFPRDYFDVNPAVIAGIVSSERWSSWTDGIGYDLHLPSLWFMGQSIAMIHVKQTPALSRDRQW
jgi:hypothetical protein